MSPLLPMPADCLHQSVVETRDHWSCACAGRLKLCGNSAVRKTARKTDVSIFQGERKSSEIKLVPTVLVVLAHKKSETEISPSSI